MTFNFTPKTDEEINRMKLLQEGKYGFLIRNATEKVSKSGNEMIELYLEVFSNDGGSVFVSDYLVSTEKMSWKIKHFCQSISIESEYETGRINVHSIMEKQGRATIVIENNKDYPSRNKVKDYIPNEKQIKDDSIQENSKKLEIPEDEDLPF